MKSQKHNIRITNKHALLSYSVGISCPHFLTSCKAISDAKVETELNKNVGRGSLNSQKFESEDPFFNRYQLMVLLQMTLHASAS